jgi:protein involved in polysaccharide export with SLBB domain
MDRGSQNDGARPGAARLVLLACGLLSLGGCVHADRHVEKKLLADRGPQGGGVAVAESYLVACPDVLEVAVAGRPDLGWRSPVAPDGCADLGPLGRPRVEGKTVAGIARVLAEQTGVPPDQVSVRVAQFNSRQLYLFGQVAGLQRAVPYEGQETVLDLLQRVGGITAGAAPDDVFVVRSHIADGTRPEVFHVDLRAIVLKNDYHTNLRLQPYDQVHVGETHQAKVERCVPPCLRPLLQFLCDTRRAPHPQAGPPR